jgi:hypothetical protein
VLVVENEFGVPAGWYPDPLGLPQLRWWDNRAWTEHTSEARAPIIIQPGSTRLAYAEDDLPSRREQREREKEREQEERDAAIATELETDDSDDRDDLSAQPLLAMTLLELEPPESDTVDEDTPGPVSAATHANTSTPRRRSTFQEEHVGLPRLAPERPSRRGWAKRTYTTAVWVIALIPVLQIAASALLITVFGLGHNLPLLLVVWVSPYLVVLGFAAYDRLVLTTAGHERPASAAWALLTAPVYLIMRAIRTTRNTGRGFAPFAIWSGATFALVATVLVLPGILISLMPGAFSAEAEQSVSATASTLGADLTLDCPAAPPLLVGELFTCRAEKPNGDTDSVAVSLQRANGWITWQVEDWGLWVLSE